MVRTLSFHCRGLGSIPDQGTKILHAVWHSQIFFFFIKVVTIWGDGYVNYLDHSDYLTMYQFSSAAQSCPNLPPHGLQHARLPCPSPTPRACSNSCPSSWWCHPTIWPSVVSFSSCLQSFPTSGSFPMSQFFTSGGQSIEFQLQHQSFQWTPTTDFL